MLFYYCHVCGAPLDYPGRCPECGEPPVRDAGAGHTFKCVLDRSTV